jgi:hypothetical protein
MVYTKSSPLKKLKGKDKKKIKKKLKPLTEFMKKKLGKHRQTHKDNGNDLKMLAKHMKVMKDLIMQGMSFNKAHTEANEKYPMQ